MASTFGMRVSTFHLRAICTGAPVVASAQKTESPREGARLGEAGRVAGSIGAEERKQMAGGVAKAAVRSSGCWAVGVVTPEAGGARARGGRLVHEVAPPRPPRTGAQRT